MAYEPLKSVYSVLAMSTIVWSLLLLSGISAQKQPIRFTALQLASRVINDLPHDNVVICPPAINLALAQLYLAAGGETEAELKSVLGYTGTTKEEVLKDFERLQRLTLRENPRFRIASRLYTKGLKLKPAFKKMLKNYSNIETDNLEVSVQGVGKINQWTSTNTDSSFEELLSPLMLEDFMKVFLVTAISFNGLWMYRFYPIIDGLFYLPDEKHSVPVKMMQVVGTFSYDFQHVIDGHVVVVPYANSNISMTLMVPRSSVGIQKMEENLLQMNLKRMAPKTVRLSLPLFKFRYRVDVIQALVDLGVNKNVFTQANLPEVTAKEKVKIDSLLHSSVIQFSDQGAKSALATGLILSVRSIDPLLRVDIHL